MKNRMNFLSMANHLLLLAIGRYNFSAPEGQVTGGDMPGGGGEGDTNLTVPQDPGGKRHTLG